MVFNEWEVRCHPIFSEIITALYWSVSDLRDKDPVGYRAHKKTRFLARIYKLVTEDIPKDPSSPRYFQGNTLGSNYRGWKRAKFERYRLFFKYSGDRRLIIDAWVNDDDTLRKSGSSNDPYKIFTDMLNRKIIHNDIDKLESVSKCPWSVEKNPIATEIP